MPPDGRSSPRRFFRPRRRSSETLALPAARTVERAASRAGLSPPRRRVGVALGGGSALGWAHIGVLRELAAQGVAVDVVAGTSIGAVVGACHAAGRLDALERFARGLNRRRVFALMDLSLGGSALIGGARLRRRLDRELAGLRIEDLAVPFAAVATELGSGREVALALGDVIEAVNASYALPGIFEPARVGGRWLFDGAMCNPVPVSVCRGLGAEVVIAVNLTGSLPGGEAFADVMGSTAAEEAPDAGSAPAVEPGRSRRGTRRLLFARRRLFRRRADGMPGIAAVVVDAFSIAQERISRARLALDPPEIMLYARTPGLGLFEFHRAAEAIAHGRLVVRRAMPDIRARLPAGDRVHRS